MAIPVTQYAREQWRHLPLTLTTRNCSGRTYIVTGSNTGIGLEAARHLASLGSKKVILGVRNKKAGDAAKLDIESTTKTRGVVEVWALDLASYESVKAFARRANKELDRIDGVIENASVAFDTLRIGAEGHDESIVINVLSTFLLAVLLLPQLKESAKRFRIMPHLTIVASEVAFFDVSKVEMAKLGDEPLRNMDDEKLCNMKYRYPLSKLVQALVARQLASLLPVDRSGVVINYVNPGLCKTTLSRNADFVTKLIFYIPKFVLGRTAEQGSRNLLFGVNAGKESHGCFTGNCEIEDDRVPEWVTGRKGQEIQQRVWDDVEKLLESVDPGCVGRALA